MFSQTLVLTRSKANTTDVYTKTQADNLLSAKEGSFTTTLPIVKNLNLLTGQIELILTDHFIHSMDDKRDAAQVDAQIDSKLAGTLTPSKIEITSNTHSHIKTTSTNTTKDSSEIAFSRESKNSYLRGGIWGYRTGSCFGGRAA